ncbi:glycosyltransferase family 4 protein [Aneurinibacillus thermoaerophilus]|uniref:Glycosyltransferase family 4 protein n=1 Tax=Aneurinibacillus thermoaerophilus TaxID=143495 RepID=A0ABX8YA37_ANETH|nr:glycosyltransferase family 4 protein [Aneurinibacillus thermoaerophilus]QYY42542.1 glycosyltransferase family 4 protein [Aneurinibacillus thermoaerophilus]
MKESIWIINQYSTTPEYPASSRHYELAKYLSKYFRVLLWGCNFVHHNKKYRFSPWVISKQEKVENFIFQWVGAIPYKDNGFSRMINMLLFAMTLFLVGVCKKERPTSIIGSSPTLFVAFAAMLLAKWKKAHFILEVRDLWPESLIEIGSKNNKNLVVKILAWMERVLYRNAEKIIVLTKGIEQRLKEKGITRDKIFFLPNGIDLKTVSFSINESKKESLRKQMGIQEDDVVFMYAGAHGPANDLAQVILAAEQLRAEKHIKFVFIGEGVEKQKLINLSKKLELDSHIIFLPAVSKSKINDYLSCADVFIICLKDIPLFEGALPNKLFDYLLHNKPIITTVKGEIKAFLEKFDIGLYGNIKEDNEYQLSEVCKKIASNKMNRNGKSINGVEIVEKYYNRERQAEQLANVIKEL